MYTNDIHKASYTCHIIWNKSVVHHEYYVITGIHTNAYIYTYVYACTDSSSHMQIYHSINCIQWDLYEHMWEPTNFDIYVYVYVYI